MKSQVSFLLKKSYLHMQDNILSSHIKNSLMLWLHDKSCLSQQNKKRIKVKWFDISFHNI